MLRTTLLLTAIFTLASCGKKGEAVGAGADQPAAAAPAGVANGQKYYSKFGSVIRIDGKANHIHENWMVKSTTISGSLDFGPNFPTEPGQAATPGKIEATGKLFIPVNSLKSYNEDGTRYDDKMDDVMYEHLKAAASPKIEYELTELVLKEPAKSKADPYLFDSKGKLTIAGVTKEVSFPVKITPMEGKRLTIAGEAKVKGTDYGVEPVNKTIVAITLKTEDEVKVSWEWKLGQAAPKAAAAK